MAKSRSNDHLPSHERRDALVQVAYRHIAEKGFEGLRVRDVASAAGINHATLLYYFPTKEALIQAVVDNLVKQFSAQRGRNHQEETHLTVLTPLQELHLEFEDVRYRFHTEPEIFVVLSELFSRSRRDRAIAHILHQLLAGWRHHLISILKRGIEAGMFRSDLDVVTTATAIMVQLIGLGSQMLEQPDIEQVDLLLFHFAELAEKWVTI